MIKNKLKPGKFFWFILICMGLIFAVSNTSMAYPLTNTNITYNSSNWAKLQINGSNVNWYTEYYLYADEFKAFDADGILDAFCVENADADNDKLYELVPVPESLNTAALIAGTWFHGNPGWSKTATQLAIWEVVFDTGLNVSVGNFQILKNSNNSNSGTLNYTSLVSEVNSILNSLGTLSPADGPIGLARSPRGSTGIESSQDYLVAAPVPEPTTLLLLSFGLVGIAGIRRFKRNQS